MSYIYIYIYIYIVVLSDMTTFSSDPCVGMVGYAAAWVKRNQKDLLADTKRCCSQHRVLREGGGGGAIPGGEPYAGLL